MKRLIGKCLVALAGASTANVYADTVEYIHTDALGTPVVVTEVSGKVVARSEYEPSGKTLNRLADDGPGYTGHVEDAATGLTYMQQRYYDPSIGMFLSVDPVTTLESDDMRYFNRYEYAFNNPYRFLDPDGRRTGSRINNSQMGRVSVVHINSSGPVGDVSAGSGAIDAGNEVPVNKKEPQAVIAIEGGVVEKKGWENPRNHKQGFGYRVRVTLGEGGVDIYAHMDPASVQVDQGDIIKPGDVIGKYASPSNGTSNGPHLHLERRSASGAAVQIDFSSVGFPVANPLLKSGYGPRIHPTTGKVGKLHNGYDFVDAAGR